MKPDKLNEPKTFLTLILSATILLSSCSFSIKSGSSPERNDVIGSWELADAGKRKSEEKITVFQFKLMPDSTATISMGKNTKTESTGKWAWKKKKQAGNDRFGISLQSDVVLYINNHLVLGMVLKETNEKLQLEVGDFSFNKSSESDK